MTKFNLERLLENKPALKSLCKEGHKNLLIFALQLGIIGGGALGISKGVDYFQNFEKDMIKKSENITAPRYLDITQKKDISKADEFLIDFPNCIPGAGRINKYLIPDSSYCLVHIRQVHPTENMFEDDKKEVTKVQKDIYSILSFLIEKNNIKEVYQEGLGVEIEEEINRTKVIREIRSEEECFDATIELRHEGKLKLKGAETIRSYLTGIAAKDLFIDSIVDSLRGTRKLKADSMLRCLKRYTDDREDILLKIASKQTDPAVLCVYGGAHRWGGKESCGKDYPLENQISTDNIAKWNLLNPHKKFSLIEITPINYPKTEDNFLDGLINDDHFTTK